MEWADQIECYSKVSELFQLAFLLTAPNGMSLTLLVLLRNASGVVYLGRQQSRWTEAGPLFCFVSSLLGPGSHCGARIPRFWKATALHATSSHSAPPGRVVGPHKSLQLTLQNFRWYGIQTYGATSSPKQRLGEKDKINKKDIRRRKSAGGLGSTPCVPIKEPLGSSNLECKSTYGT